jgi:hypothetical protein
MMRAEQSFLEAELWCREKATPSAPPAKKAKQTTLAAIWNPASKDQQASTSTANPGLPSSAVHAPKNLEFGDYIAAGVRKVGATMIKNMIMEAGKPRQKLQVG